MIAENIARLEIQIKAALKNAGRDRNSLRVVLVSKMFGAESVREAYDAGVRDFAENKIQEWLGKQEDLPKDIRWHFVGRLQQNKVRHLAEFAARYPQPILLHSLDREELADEIVRQAELKKLKQLPCLIQINTSGEESKAGFDAESAVEFVSRLKQYPALDVRGLMTIGPLTDDKAKIRKAFRDLRDLRDKLKKQFQPAAFDILSMGMSQDFEIAIEEGSNLIRIGTAVFGERVKG